MNSKYSVVDLFCGVGGLTHGFVKQGFKVNAGVDFNESCCFAYEKNNNAKFWHYDLSIDHSSTFVNSLFDGDKKILIGCAPCQAFSNYNKNLHNNKWKLVYSFGRIIGDILPDIISMENVPQLATYRDGAVFEDFLTVLHKNNYHVDYKIVNAQDYGVPQRRKRLILLASRLGEISLIPPTHNSNNFVTVRNAIGHLPPINDGQSLDDDKLHRARKLSDLNIKRIKSTPEGGSWRNWDESLILDCHKKKSGKSFGSVYGRMKWDEVSPTLTTQCTGYGNGRYGHPEQNRAISIREASILQSFPADYEFINPNIKYHPSIIEKQIGNAVPVELGCVIARSIKEHLNTH